MDLISIGDFSKIEIRVGEVVEAKNVEGSKKLIRLVVDFNEPEKRIIFTGVRQYGYIPENFLNKQFLFVANLEPRKMPSYVETSEGKLPEYSQGMILAVDSSTGLEQVGSGAETKPIFISGENLPLGSKVR